jgi:DNA-directed RNA polymerase subunit K/omega
MPKKVIKYDNDAEADTELVDNDIDNDDNDFIDDNDDIDDIDDNEDENDEDNDENDNDDEDLDNTVDEKDLDDNQDIEDNDANTVSETNFNNTILDNISNIANYKNLNEFVPSDKRISASRLTKYEMVRILGERTKQLSLGAKPLLKNCEELSFDKIAEEELKLNMTPFKIIRTLPNGTKELWKLNELYKDHLLHMLED